MSAARPLPLVLATCESRPDLATDDELLRAALERRGVPVVVEAWDRVAPGDSSLVCLRSTWDYHKRWPEFRRWATGLAGRPGALWNPSETVLWNADKAYLRELAGAGLPLPRTRWFAPGERPDCDAILKEWGASRGVLKPRISATAYGTHLVSAGARWTDASWRPLEAHGSLFQAFVPEIETDGELSLIFLDGGFSHAVRKLAAPGNYRVQTDFGGRWEPIATPRAMRAFGARVLATASRPWVYARVDVVEAASGPLLMELELIEPQLFLTEAAAERLADALKRRWSRGV